MLATECGFTPAEVREMTLDDAATIFAHWRREPPLRVLVASVAAALGVELPKPTDKPAGKKRGMSTEEARRMIAATGGFV